MEQEIKTYVISGATSGIGFATAKRLASKGATVIGIGRSPSRCQEAETALRLSSKNSNINFLIADLGNQNETILVANQIGELLKSKGRNSLEGLVNNAGVFTYWMTLTAEGIEKQWAVNHMAAFNLTNLLMPLLNNSETARIVTVSSDSHYAGRINWDDPQLRRNYNGLQAYENTKLANVLFTYEINNRLEAGSHVKALAVDPGLVKTEIGFKNLPSTLRWIWRLRSSAGTSPEIPAAGIDYLLSEPAIQQSPYLYWKNCQPKKPGKRAINPQSSAWLWQYSEALSGLNKMVKYEN